MKWTLPLSHASCLHLCFQWNNGSVLCPCIETCFEDSGLTRPIYVRDGCCMYMLNCNSSHPLSLAMLSGACGSCNLTTSWRSPIVHSDLSIICKLRCVEIHCCPSGFNFPSSWFCHLQVREALKEDSVFKNDMLSHRLVPGDMLQYAFCLYGGLLLILPVITRLYQT